MNMDNIKTKPLYVLVSDRGDGSYGTHFTFNTEWIRIQESKVDHNDFAIGVDGDGFHYSVINIPEFMSLKDLGILFDCSLE